MSEMASLGQAVEPLVERVARRDLEDRGDDPGSPKKKQKSGARQAKRGPEADIEELHHQMQDEAVAGAVVDEEGAVVMGPLPSAGSHQEFQSQLQKLHLEAAAPWI